MNEELPESWEPLPLGQACHVIRGITFPASAKQAKETKMNVACLRTANIQDEVEWDDIYFVSDEYVKREDQLVKPGDTLMSMANSYNLVGKVALAKEVPYKTAFGAFLSAVRPTSLVSPLYLFHLLRTSHVQSELRSGSSQTTNIANISIGKLSSIEIPIAPLAEQKRIADKLEAMLGRVDSCRARLDRVPALLKRFRQSVLAAATSGKLTEEWRNENSKPETTLTLINQKGGLSPVPETWQWRSLESTCEYVVDCPHTTPKWTEKGRLCVRTTNFKPGFLDLSTSQFVSEETFKVRNERLVPKPNDILYSREGGILGIACIIPEKVELCLGQRMMLLRVKAGYQPAMLMHWLNSPVILHRVRELTGGTASPHLNVRDIRAFPIPIPPLPEQQEIVRRVEALFAFADRIEARLATAQKTIERLTPATLAKAFRGELVPQDPNDEPASALLDQLRATAGQTTQKPKRRGKA